jgi:hypothetical protein
MNLQGSGGKAVARMMNHVSSSPANAGTHTARSRYLSRAVDAFFEQRDARGYGSPRARGRRLEMEGGRRMESEQFATTSLLQMSGDCVVHSTR